ncbi:uncharacterized protein SPPG_09102 [Spizellomyces punctatus DAOM BR117]|uniref:Zn(2)-C6 fungal-type domain-containing protein n=1 Tax=Spizellomyces punctatus (strain DAOM BR117) TaxID=645134 RepID=A0A0L0HKL2_SPIPD|nr:uncharacterized protein SPPG_09102 [Spizellomyces punctatus DAOM BR117]KND01440.1 hypothetical protein SPPG_09102 [Spizellomyces punctatus DAOM BR117]|eukprot:XP_016609479.1 hypothetical protein SPPG_09102 [Spizellomyces punctatus DAOM BR117]
MASLDSGSPSTEAVDSSPAKKGRIQACDRCRVRKRKCNGARPTCNNCEKARDRGILDVECTYAEKKKRPRRQLRDVLIERLEALEALLRPLQEGGAAPSASTAAAARAEMAGIMQGLSSGRKADAVEDAEESGDEQDEDEDENDGEESWMDWQEGQRQIVGTQQQAITMTAAVAAGNPTYSSPPPSDPPASDDDLSEGSPAMPITYMLGNEVPVFDAVSWPSLVPPHLPLGSAEMTYAIDPQTFLTAIHPSTPIPQSMQTTVPLELPHLFTHLIALYFAFINTCMPLFDEAYFFSNLIPTNRHSPALLYAIYAYGCLHSRHPALYQEPYRNPRTASELFHAEATKALEGVTDTITRLQVLIMLGKWSFGMNQPAKALQYFSSAIQATERARLGFAGGHEANRLLSLWGAPTSCDPRHTLLTLRITWMFCFTADTMTSMAAELNPAMEESNYTHILAEAVDSSRASLVSLPATSSPELEDKGLWRQLLHGHPSYTIHDFRPNAWTPSLELLETHCDRTKPWFLQLQFLLRRIQRFSRDVPFDTRRYEGTSASLVFSVLPKPSGCSAQEREQERIRLHNVLVEWWSTLPPEERSFDSLEVFRDGRLPPLPSVAQLASFQYAMMNAFYIAAFALVHHREGVDLEMDVTGTAGYRTCVTLSNVPLATSAEILMLTMRAKAFLIRAIYAMNGFTTIPPTPSRSPAEEFSPASPAPPLLFIQNPVTCYTVWLVGAAFLAFVSRVRQNGIIPRSALRDPLIQEGLDIITTVYLPMLESGRRIWTIMDLYANKLKQLLEKVERGEVVGIRQWSGARASELLDISNELNSSLRL